MATGLNQNNQLQSLRLDEHGSLLVSWGPPPEMPYIVSAFGSQNITNNTTSVALTASPDQTLTQDTGYVQITQNWDAIPNGFNHLITQLPNGELQIQRDGIYRVDMWASVSASDGCRVGFKHSVNGNLNSGRTPVVRIGPGWTFNDLVTVAAHGFRAYSAGDVIGLWWACTDNRNVTLAECLVTVQELLTGEIGP